MKILVRGTEKYSGVTPEVREREINTIEDLLAVRKETVMNGRWIKVSGNICTADCVIYKCSICGEQSKWVRGMKTIYPNDVCPHCHADMLLKRTASTD